MKLAPENDLPVCCSVCLQSPAAFTPKLTYVNCEAGYDGPVVRDPEKDNPEASVLDREPGVYIENIVICEICVREMAGLLGLEDVKNLQEHVSALEAHADQKDAEVAEKDRAISDLQYTVGTLIKTPVKRPEGRPQLRGPDDQEEILAELRRRKGKNARVQIAGDLAAKQA